VVTGLVIPAQYERPVAVMLPARHRCVRLVRRLLSQRRGEMDVWTE